MKLPSKLRVDIIENCLGIKLSNITNSLEANSLETLYECQIRYAIETLLCAIEDNDIATGIGIDDKYTFDVSINRFILNNLNNIVSKSTPEIQKLWGIALDKLETLGLKPSNNTKNDITLDGLYRMQLECVTTVISLLKLNKLCKSKNKESKFKTVYAMNDDLLWQLFVTETFSEIMGKRKAMVDGRQGYSQAFIADGIYNVDKTTHIIDAKLYDTVYIRDKHNKENIIYGHQNNVHQIRNYVFTYMFKHKITTVTGSLIHGVTQEVWEESSYPRIGELSSEEPDIKIYMVSVADKYEVVKDSLIEVAKHIMNRGKSL